MPYSLLSNSPVSGQIAWSDVRLVYDGVDYVIANGTTNKRFVYWLKSTPSAFQVADALPALGPDDTVVFLNKNGIAINVLNATALEGDLVVPGTITSNAIATDAIDASHIKSNAIVGRHILAGEITADKLTVTNLAAISADMGDLTSGSLTIDQTGFVRGGASSYGTGTGFWMGYHSGKYKLRAGTPGSSGFEWDGSAFNVYGPDGNLTISSGVVDWEKVGGSNKPADGATRNVFRGDWTASTAYVIGDIVLKAGNGWSCILAHTSASGNQPPVSGSGNTWWAAYTVKGSDGAQGLHALTVIVPNGTHTLPAASNGAVGSYLDSGTTIQVFEGTTALSAVSSITANSQFTIGTPTQSPSSTITVGNRTYAGTTATVAAHSAMANGADSVVITYPITVRRSDGTSVSLSVTQTITKSKAGANGTNGVNAAVAFIYRRATSTPALPSVSSTYTFATGGITGLNNSWTATVPAGTDPLYVSTAAASGTGATATIAAASWAAPVVLAQNGLNGSTGSAGAPGLNSATVYLFCRTATSTPPTLPSTTATYTFSTSALSGHNNGWTTTLPGTGGAYRWVTLATAASTGASDTIAPAEWSAPALLAEDGAKGDKGDKGDPGAPGDAVDIVFQRSASQPATPAASAGVPSGWYSSVSAVPASSNPMWSCVGEKLSGSTNYTWQVPLKIEGSAGSSGSNGLSIAELTIFIRSASAPATPTGGTYNFATKVLTPPSGWSDAIPSGTNPVYASRSVVSSTNPSATAVAPKPWSAPVVSFQNGDTGATGPQGPTVSVSPNRAATFTATDNTLDASQANIVFTASVTGIGSASYAWSFARQDGSGTTPTASTSATYTITQANFGTSRSATVTCTVNGTYTDTYTIVRLEKSTAAPGATAGPSMGTDLSQWTLNGQQLVTVGDGKVGEKALRLTTAAGYPTQEVFIPIDPTKIYRVSFWARPSVDCNGLLYFSLRQAINETGTWGPNNGGRAPYKPSAQNVAAHNAALGGTGRWGEYRAYWTSADWQDGVKFFRPEFLNNHGGTTGYWEIQGLVVQEVTDVESLRAVIVDIASDNKLTPVEKKQLLRQYDAITAEVNTINNQGLAFGITTSRTNYVNRYNELTTYVTPLFSNMLETSTIVSIDLRNAFGNYYAAREVLLNDTAFASASYAQWAGVSGAGKPLDNAGKVIDGARDTNPAPQDWVIGESFYFKSAAAFGITGVTYGTLRTVRPYGVGADLSGGAVLQWFEAEQMVWARKSASATTWSAWQRVPNETITSANVSTYIASAAIGAAQIGSVELVGESAFKVRTNNTLGARMDMDSRRIKIFDASGALRVQLGDLTV